MLLAVLCGPLVLSAAAKESTVKEAVIARSACELIDIDSIFGYGEELKRDRLNWDEPSFYQELAQFVIRSIATKDVVLDKRVAIQYLPLSCKKEKDFEVRLRQTGQYTLEYGMYIRYSVDSANKIAIEQICVGPKFSVAGDDIWSGMNRPSTPDKTTIGMLGSFRVQSTPCFNFRGEFDGFRQIFN